jgi:protein DGCR14
VKEKFVIEAQKPAGLITASQEGVLSEEEGVGDGESEQFLVLYKQATEAPSLDVMAPQKDTRPAGVDGWKFKARNSLMFAPDANISPYHQPKSAQVDANLKGVHYASTRLPEHEHQVGESEFSEPPSPTRSRIDAAITGTPYRPSSPKQQTFPLVPNLPSPTPAELGPIALKHLMTWGTLTSTPRIISETGDSVDLRTPFHIPAITAREVMGHKLSDNASKSLRAKADMLGSTNRLKTAKVSLLGKKRSMGPPPSTPRRAEAAGNLTPAARRLLQRTTIGTAAKRRAEVMERDTSWDSSKEGKGRDLDRVRWTPTPTPVSRR